MFWRTCLSHFCFTAPACCAHVSLPCSTGLEPVFVLFHYHSCFCSMPRCHYPYAWRTLEGVPSTCWQLFSFYVPLHLFQEGSSVFLFIISPSFSYDGTVDILIILWAYSVLCDGGGWEDGGLPAFCLAMRGGRWRRRPSLPVCLLSYLPSLQIPYLSTCMCLCGEAFRRCHVLFCI
jgi:hypothetical protein